MSSRYGSQALAAVAADRPVSGCYLLAKVGGHLVGRFCVGQRFSRVCDRLPKSVVTSLAGFAGARRPQPPGGRTATPAAFR